MPQPDRDSEPERRLTDAKPSAKALTILVVEDEAVIAMLLEEVLVEMGHTVCDVQFTQAGAVASAEKHRPDLIVADVTLGAGSGITAIETILAERFVPHIFISGHRLDMMKLHPTAGLLQKPFLESELAEAIAKVTGSTGSLT